MTHVNGQRLRTLRRQVVEIHGNRCARCGRPIDLSLSGLHPQGLTLGHAIPLARGGTDAIGNLRPEHRACNLAAGARLDPPRATLAKPVQVE